MQTFALLPPVLNQSFSNDSNADLLPFSFWIAVLLATCLPLSLCANSSHQHVPERYCVDCQNIFVLPADITKTLQKILSI